MVKGGGSRSRSGGAKGRPSPKQAAKRTPAARRAARPAPSPAAPPPPAELFRLGAIPGATPGKWIDAWRERMPRTELVLAALAVADQRRALVDDEVDAALVRLPIDREDLHVIALYEEVPVVVVSAESHLSLAEELELADLAGEVVIRPRDDVLAVEVPGGLPPRFDPPADTAEAIATVATGVGIVIVPMSLARLHHRKDVVHRPLRDGPASSVALAWVAARTTTEVEAFVGIVRGRTARSSRA
ncbi:LysR family substrate-binding domain-containing protein [Microbacterium hominis]|uniref:LysR family substrate-binding domain-containing protein n=1 Tax=Microbacterium hominis TaxID=162426 RepID=A0A7D4PZK6_9MICO|nr:LysR family substrate-binding domain-containing protein [Microbacterium hominis]QKJ18412.1 LysR family substrate-binding domain-containing protein [Microbacterium hominis]